MRFRIQPKEVEIPEQDPFKNDLLGRQEPAEVLTRMLRSIEGPCVLAVDAPWGAGKTTFLNMLARHLRNQEFPVVEFNAWETDFTSDPFLALSEELTNGVREYTTGPLSDEIEKVKAAAKEVVRLAVPGVIRLATAGILDISPLIEKEAGQAIASLAKKRLSEYLDARTSLQTFRASLGEFATRLAESRHSLPLIAVIDELDRCRPSYAVELLETAKHLFTVDRVVFVLAVNRSELAHSIRAVYGGEFDALGYLRRFIDVDFRLPEAQRERFIEATLVSVGIEDYLKSRPRSRTLGDDYESIKGWLAELFSGPDLSLRRIAQSIHRLGLVFASLQKDSPSFALAATTAVVMRTLESDLYERFRRGEAEDREVVDFFRSRSSKWDESGIGRHLEAVLIVAASKIRNPEHYIQHAKPSPLLAEYRKAADKAQQSIDSNDIMAERARQVVDIVGTIGMNEFRGYGGLGFEEAFQRIELLSPSLIGDDEERSDGGRDN